MYWRELITFLFSEFNHHAYYEEHNIIIFFCIYKMYTIIDILWFLRVSLVHPLNLDSVGYVSNFF